MRRSRYFAAIDIVCRKGWWPGPSHPVDGGTTLERGPQGQVCIATAVSDAFPPEDVPDALAHLKRVLGLPPDDGSLGAWNDAPGRTSFDVVQALMNASYGEPDA